MPDETSDTFDRFADHEGARYLSDVDGVELPELTPLTPLGEAIGLIAGNSNIGAMTVIGEPPEDGGDFRLAIAVFWDKELAVKVAELCADYTLEKRREDEEQVRQLDALFESESADELFDRLRTEGGDL